MQNKIFSALCFCFLLLPFFAYATQQKSKQQIILTIKSDYSTINKNLPHYSKIEKSIFGKSAEGARAIYYAEDNKFQNLKKIQVTYFGETGKALYELYYKESKLFFVFKQDYNYNTSIWYDEKTRESPDAEIFDPKKSKITEERYYLHDDKLIMWLNANQQEVETSLPLFIEKESAILRQSAELQKEMKNCLDPIFQRQGEEKCVINSPTKP